MTMANMTDRRAISESFAWNFLSSVSPVNAGRNQRNPRQERDMRSAMDQKSIGVRGEKTLHRESRFFTRTPSVPSENSLSV
jgi:hypothetical protein